MKKFKFRDRTWQCKEDLTDFFTVVPNPTPYRHWFNDGEYTFRTHKKGERIIYYVFQNQWYIVEKSLMTYDAAHEVVDFNLIPCKKESEWETLAKPEVYKCLSPRWAAYVRAWKWLKWKRDLRIEYFCSKSIPKRAFRKRK